MAGRPTAPLALLPTARTLGSAMAAVVVVVVATYGCRDATQVTVTITTANVKCGALKGVDISVAGDRDEAERRAHGFVTTSAICADPESFVVGTIVVTPGPSGDAAIVVVAGIVTDATTCRATPDFKGCVVARRSLAFRDHVSAAVPVLIEPRCLDVPCDVATTCTNGACISSEYDCADDGSCASRDPRGNPGVDGGSPGDGGAPDGSVADGNPSDAVAPDSEPADAGIDGSLVDGSLAGCMSSCPYNGMPTCAPAAGTLCCYRQGGPGGNPAPSKTCDSPAACTGSGTRHGISACCWSNGDCGVGEQCCFRALVDGTHPEPTGQTFCAASCAADEQVVCNASNPSACLAFAPKNCIAIGSAQGYGGEIFTCQ